MLATSNLPCASKLEQNALKSFRVLYELKLAERANQLKTKRMGVSLVVRQRMLKIKKWTAKHIPVLKSLRHQPFFFLLIFDR
jgi:hypothetical protein